MSRRIAYRQTVAMDVTVCQETFSDAAEVRAISPSNRPGGPAESEVVIVFGMHTEPDHPWYGDEPEFRLTKADARDLRDAIDQALQVASDMDQGVIIPTDFTTKQDWRSRGNRGSVTP